MKGFQPSQKLAYCGALLDKVEIAQRMFSGLHLKILGNVLNFPCISLSCLYES